MSFALPFTAAAKAKKEAKAVLAAARTFVLSYEDLPAYRAGGDKASLLFPQHGKGNSQSSQRGTKSPI